MKTIAGYLHFWGKARGARPGEPGEPGTHPVAYHSLDVAAAGDALLSAYPRRLERIAQLMGTTSDNARRCIVTLIALHDIGKFAETFQAMVPEAWPSMLGDLPESAMRRHHTVIALDLFGRLELRHRLAPAFDSKGWDRGLALLWAAVACHHGKPEAGTDDLDDEDAIRGMRRTGIRAAKDFTADVVEMFGPYTPLAPMRSGSVQTLSWIVAGLTNLADWIGSNRDAFPYRKPLQTLADYWIEARASADSALAASGLLPVTSVHAPTLQALFTGIDRPSPLQEWSQTVALPPGPVLTVIEDVTGSGKTEAALVLASRLLADHRAGGVFFALPTMATANAMFDRLGPSYRRMFVADHDPSLVLAHGRSGLHDGFNHSILAHANTDAERTAETSGDGSSAVCAAWIADDRRKAFLAHVGVGTIDQAFLGVLPAKHQALRLWGLADRVLIVDEAHAYDAYMGRELERLLEFHAALGGSAIVLSATLPSGQRAALANAFARGLGATIASQPVEAYPLATIVSGQAVCADPLSTRADRVRQLPVRSMQPGSDALAYVVDMAQRGAAVAWIRNAVDDAIEATEDLRARGVTPILLHARFAMGDRLAIETLVRETLGKSGTADGRRGFVLVGTQILEQSLDYDVDAMVTDLAPIDLIIQRAGRLWRHEERTRAGRPIAAPELIVVTPDWQTVADSNWYRQVSPRAAAVYKHHGVIWRTAKSLADCRRIETPDGVRALIEGVYAPTDTDDLPKPLLRAANEADGQFKAFRATANANLLDVRAGYSGNNALWTADTMTPTRLGDPVTVFRLGRVERNIVVPWCVADDGNERRSWALSEVSLSQRKAVGVPTPDAATAAMVEQAKASWSEWKRDQPLLVLTGDDAAATGTILAQDGKALPVVYGRRTTGLRIVST